MATLRPRPRIIPQSETGELNAVFRRKWAKRARERAPQEGWDNLSSADEAAKEILSEAPKINLLKPQLRMLRDISNFQQIRQKLQNLYPRVRALLDHFTPKEWAALVEKGLRFARQSVNGFISAVKGRLLELNFQYSGSPVLVKKLCEHKVAEVLGPDSIKWGRNLVIITESYSIYGNSRKQFADFLFVVFDNIKSPTRAWIVGAVESKSDTNAIELVFYGARPDIPDSGEFLGQLHLRSEQLDNLQIDLPGYGQFSAKNNLYFGTLRKGGSVQARWSKEDTIYVGVIPSDTPTEMRRKIELGLANMNSLLLEHENITGNEARQLAASFVDILPNLDDLTK